MIITTTNDWERSDKSGLVSAGSYSLFVSTGGPTRRPGALVVIFITGGGAPTELYVHLHRAISKLSRNYFYDRAGYGRSERPASDDSGACDRYPPRSDLPTDISRLGSYTNHPWWTAGDTHKAPSSSLSSTRNDAPQPSANSSIKPSREIKASDSASELHALMRAIGVAPPYVLAAHSYGGIIARTFLDLFPDDVAGIALLDTNSGLLQQCLGPIPPPAFGRVVADVDPEDVLHLRKASGMSDAEWTAAVAAVAHTRAASADEATHESGRELARCRQIDKRAMGDKPLLVMCSDMAGDLRKLFEEGMKKGGGTRDERCEAEWWLESVELFSIQVQRVQLDLSTESEYVVFEDVGHDFPTRVPERTAELVRRLLAMVKQQRIYSGLVR
ncbi:hypothetical protein PMZ80_000613 [Knufia obscura]|uniref:AB hydrolase-1 domain-containing protein n=1 Tax=Knufia obscura TaxID=1635080 RepID=A0ABR0S0V1_9EURO|nr:hypothetical protein PMZ80_000613 [Knufia obscura]